MDEIDFLLLHKIVVHQLKAKGDMKMAIRLMKLNKIVCKHAPDVQEEDKQEREANEPVQSNGHPSTSKDKKTQQKKQAKKKKKDALQVERDTDENKPVPSNGLLQANKNKKQDTTANKESTDENEPGPSNELLADVIYLRLDWQKGTQTGEDNFQKNNVDEMRTLFLVDEIKAEDFDSEYEKDVEGNTTKAKRKSDHIDNGASTSSVQPVRDCKRLKKCHEDDTMRSKSEQDQTKRKKSEDQTTREKELKKKSKELKSKEEKQKLKKEEQSREVTRMIHEIERELMEEGKQPFEVSNEVIESRLKIKIDAWKLKKKAERDHSKSKGKLRETDIAELSDKSNKAGESQSESRAKYTSRCNKRPPGGKGLKSSE